MDTRSIEKELLDLERSYWQALKDNDLDAALLLTDDPCIVTGPQGIVKIDKKAYRDMMRNPSWSLKDFQLADGAEVRLLGRDVAILAYQVREELDVEGKPVTLEAAESSTWVRHGGGWVCAMHSEALSGDPFGRDRRTVP